ncbi:hypothetical protein Pmani_031102 [Petrolisthes manimaculis]|uniref:Timeless n=1 Tax=Petrolisthes manimaculis TaxID=1843537 RepID=A0AAE1NUC0_9EUCA|nr:hypothetical protein Pmani_031102 [Petrolisthes manimaculis]
MLSLTEHLQKVSLRSYNKAWRRRRRGQGRGAGVGWWPAQLRLARMAELRLTYQRAKIEEIIHRLNQDKARWHFRRSLFMNKIISKNLLPLLIHVKEDRGLMEVTVKALQELMMPVECLMPAEIMNQNNEGQRIIYELESCLVNTKKLFLDTRVTKSIIDLMSSVLQDSKLMTLPECELINQCLLLVRNLLHVSSIPSASRHHTGPSSSVSSSNTITKQQGGAPLPVVTEDQIMWNLFAQRFDNILIQLLTCKQQHLWNVTMVQLVSLMYRDQQQSTIRKLINEWLESSLSESSEDDENNPMSSSSSDDISSDPVSDSSERLSPMDGMNNNEKLHMINRNENSDTSTVTNKVDKGDSSKDSGFGRSGSNMDSSPDEMVSDSTKQSHYRHQKQKLHGKYTDETGFYAKEHTRKTQDENLDIDAFFASLNNPKEYAEIKRLRECDGSECAERESDQGGSEGSSPMPSIEQPSPLPPMDNLEGDRYIMQYVQSNQKTNLTSPESVMEIYDGTELKEEKKDVHMSPMRDKAVVQEVCPSQEPIKLPPKEEESGSSGDSSVNKPPPQLPKLHKNKPTSGQKRSRHTMSQKMLSDTQENNESSNSTGSECDEGPHAKRPHHQKPHKMLSKPRPAKMIQKAQQERNIKRTKLIKRKESNSIKTKALLHHHPTAEDISNLLKEFTVDFMLNGYSNLLEGLRLQVLLPYQVDLDKSHLLWLITYFLRFAVELDLELSQICPVLSVDVVSYLAYEGVVMQEELEQAIRSKEDNLVPHVRRLHLVVTALREFFVAFDVCLKKEHNLIDAQHLLKIKEELGELTEVRQLFVYLIRMYRPGLLTLNYLQDLITTNHRFLTTQEAHSPSRPAKQHFDVYSHIKQFATMDMMRQYGRLLENFHANEETVNDCIFTMMHHIAGDLRNINVLLQPCILRVFLRIWKEGFELCVDWADLIEYVLRKCTRIRIEHSHKKERKDSQKAMPEPTGIELTNEDLDQLYNHYSSTTSEEDLMDKIKEICCDDAIEEPIKKEVIEKLLARGFITTSECSKLCAEIPSLKPLATVKSEGEVSLECDVMQVSSDSEDSQDAKQVAFKHGKKILIDKNLGDNQESQQRMKTVTSASQVLAKIDEKDAALDKKEPLESIHAYDKMDGSQEDNTVMTEDTSDWEESTNFTYLIDKVRIEGFASQVQWLQHQLLEACYSKVKFVRPDPNVLKAEPIAFHFTLSNQSIPLIPWTSEQEEAFASLTFRTLMRELGLHLPSDTGKLFPRIPHFWCPDILFAAAKRLGPISSHSLRVSLEHVQMMMQQMRAMSLTGAVKTEPLESEEHFVIRGSSAVDCDDSSERVSDCSMENNKSCPSSPASMVDEKLTIYTPDNECSKGNSMIPRSCGFTDDEAVKDGAEGECPASLGLG